MNRWNNADTTLLCAALCFVAACGFKIVFPESIFAEGFLFVTEAAMVGGIADWFAVTALFKKPLGFPFHTAILPHRREDFVKASTQMVQQEFFSRRTLFKKVDHLDFLPMLAQNLENPATKHFLLNELLFALKKYVSSMDKTSTTKFLVNKLRRELEKIPVQPIIEGGGKWILETGKDVEILNALTEKLRTIAAKPETRLKIQELLEKFAEERTKSAGSFSMLMAGLAQMLDFVNFEEAAEIIQIQLLKLLDELSTDSPIRRRTLEECRLKFSALSETAEFRNLLEILQVDLIAALPLEERVESAISKFEQQILSAELNEFAPVMQDSKTLGSVLAETLIGMYDNLIIALKNDSPIKRSVEKFLGELKSRATLYAQPLVGEVAKSALDRMTPEQLNNLVYDKAEKDFVWIRMNGSIVGSIIGLIIFSLIKIVS